MNKIIAKLAERNELRGVIDQTDFNDPEKLGKGKEMVDRLTNLVSITGRIQDVDPHLRGGIPHRDI